MSKDIININAIFEELEQWEYIVEYIEGCTVIVYDVRNVVKMNESDKLIIRKVPVLTYPIFSSFVNKVLTDIKEFQKDRFTDIKLEKGEKVIARFSLEREVHV